MAKKERSFVKWSELSRTHRGRYFGTIMAQQGWKTLPEFDEAVVERDYRFANAAPFEVLYNDLLPGKNIFD